MDNQQKLIELVQKYQAARMNESLAKEAVERANKATEEVLKAYGVARTEANSAHREVRLFLDEQKI